MDILHYWQDRSYYIKGSALFSHVLGTNEKILATQTAFEHLFQRPNGTEFQLDGNRTSLTGTGGTLRIGKSGGFGILTPA